ncbi:unnamed protein product, partial [Adineta ricciae]
MQTNFEQLIVEATQSSVSSETLEQLTLHFQQNLGQSLPAFLTQIYKPLLLLEHKVWHIFSESSNNWCQQSSCLEFFQALAAFNKNLIFQSESITIEEKISLLIPESIDLINTIFERIDKCTDDSNNLITYANYWFKNLSYLVHEYPQLQQIPMIVHINEYFAEHFLLTEKFRFYLSQLCEPKASSIIFTSKQLFYLQTCPLSLNTYFYTDPTVFAFGPEPILKHVANEYLQIIQVQSFLVESWSRELLGCMTHLIGFMRSFLWWARDQGTELNHLLVTENILCDYVRALLHIIEYEPFYKSLKTQWCNDETILFDSILLFLMNIIQTQNIDWFFRSFQQLPTVLLRLADASAYYRIYLCSYGILSEVLSEEYLKELKITDNIKVLFFNLLEQAWNNPVKKFKQIHIGYFLRGFLNLSKNDFIQEGTAKTKRITLFVDMCDQYPIVFDIIWALSFNHDIQQQLREDTPFIHKLTRLSNQATEEQIRKAVDGILWNLQIHQQSHPSPDISSQNAFDIMISYSHKDKPLCKQIYDELTRRNYRVWIDFDQMHGNVMDAMAEAIDRSRSIIICMSEEYRKSNFCRAEAHYAFQQQRHIVPVLMQKHYKPDGWLLFLMGQLLYVNFTKYEFDQAMGMLLKELGANDVHQVDVQPVVSKDAAEVSLPSVPRTTTSITKPLSLDTERHSMLQWAQAEVQEWLTNHHLVQLCRLLSDCDGRSLVHLY